jgi:hypothetical protein
MDRLRTRCGLRKQHGGKNRGAGLGLRLAHSDRERSWFPWCCHPAQLDTERSRYVNLEVHGAGVELAAAVGLGVGVSVTNRV